MAARKSTTKKKKNGLMDPIKPRGGVAGRRNPNLRSQLDEFGNPKTPKKKNKK